jgi:hypothetical protein
MLFYFNSVNSLPIAATNEAACYIEFSFIIEGATEKV